MREMISNGSPNQQPAIVWLQSDLRVSDNRALSAASHHGSVIPVFIREPNGPKRPLGGARTWWLHQSLQRLGTRLGELGAPLVLLTGDPAKILPQLIADTGASAIYWNRCYDPACQARDAELEQALVGKGIEVGSFPGQLLHEPNRLRTGGGSYYRVYSPFWRAIEADVENRPPVASPARLAPCPRAPAGEDLEDWALLPVKPDWTAGLRETWVPGEDGARAQLDNFLDEGLTGYAERRDLPGVAATSGLSPHLANGEITPAQIINALNASDAEASPKDRTVFRKEVGWREFSWHLLVNQPQLAQVNHNRRFDAFSWRSDDQGLRAWQKGLTGYPIVDAGMRQLWHTGWMHNRVRMVTASFLTKHLLIDWREGEAWFWDTLVDADPASNSASWQWVAGTGADAAPYFRIFNPILQGEKFDCDGDYVRRYVPELAAMPTKYIHKPWAAPEAVLKQAGVRLGDTYPEPIVEHQAARNRALAAYEKIKDAA